MDTIETEAAPVGGEDVTSSQDTVAQVDTQTADVSDTGVDGATESEAGEATAPLLAGKYKSPEELAKAYKELESKLGETSRKAALVNKLEESTNMTSQQIEAYLERQKQEQMQQRIQNDPAGYALQEVESLKQQLALSNEEKELDQFLQKNPEYTPFKEKIFTLGLKLETDKSYEEIAQEYFGQARAQGQTDAYKKIESKKMTQPTGISSVPKKQISEEDLKGLSVAELEALLPRADISHRL